MNYTTTPISHQLHLAWAIVGAGGDDTMGAAEICVK